MTGRENASIADRFVSVMADIARMDEGMANDAPERFAVWRLKDAAQAHICDAIMSARRDVEACKMLRDVLAETATLPPNAPHEGPGGFSPGPLDAVVGPQTNG